MIIKDDSSCHTLLNKSLRFSLILRSSQGVLTLLMSQRDLLRRTSSVIAAVLFVIVLNALKWSCLSTLFLSVSQLYWIFVLKAVG